VTDDPAERARRQARLQQVEALFDPLPLDVAVSRSYGLIVASVVAAGRRHRSRVADLLIAAIAHANARPLYTRNPDDFLGLEELITVTTI
jgi:predicted nucleic acid-binding protein